MKEYFIFIVIFLLVSGLAVCQESEEEAYVKLKDLLKKTLALAEGQNSKTAETLQYLYEFLNSTSLDVVKQYGLYDLPTPDGTSFLIIIAKGGLLSLVKAALRAGAFVDIRDENGWTPLNWAIRRNHTEIALHLIQNGADPNIANTKHGDSPLMWAALNGQLEVVEALLNASARVNHFSKDKDSALYLAANKGHLQIVKMLLEKGADVDFQNERGWNPLITASRWNFVDIVKELLKAGANPDLKTFNGDTGLHWAVSNGHNLIVRELLVGGANYELPNFSGRTPLMLTAFKNRPEEAELLLSAGADINRQDESGDTPFMDAVNRGYANLARVFLKHCPDLSIPNRNRWTVTFLAEIRNVPEIREMIQAHPRMQCLHDINIYTLGQTRFDACREVKCCHGVWSPTGQTLASCGKQCRRVLAPAGVCTLISNCPLLQREFLDVVGTSTNPTATGREFVNNHGCGFGGGSDLRVCCPTA